MNFLNGEFDSLTIDPKKFSEKYETGTHLLPRKMILLHTLKYLIHVKQQMNSCKKNSISTHHLKQIKLEDTTVDLCRVMNINYQNLIAEKDEPQLNSKDIFKLIWRTFRSDIIAICIFFSIEALSRLYFSYLVFFLFEAVRLQNSYQAYLYCTILTILWQISEMFEHHAPNVAFLMAPKIKACLSMLLFCKVSKLTSSTVRSNYTGTITNLIANDLLALDERIPLAFNLCLFVIGVLGVTAIMLNKMGAVGMVGVLVLLLVIPVTHLISKANSHLTKELTVLKDKRIQISTEVIEGIKYVKLYGWQIAFRKRIYEIRDRQIQKIKKLGLGRSFERALGKTIGFLSSYILFLIAVQWTKRDWSGEEEKKQILAQDFEKVEKKVEVQ